MKKLDVYKYNDLKTIRNFRGISQMVLSKRSGVNLRMIQNYEQRIRDINPKILSNIS